MVAVRFVYNLFIQCVVLLFDHISHVGTDFLAKMKNTVVLIHKFV